LKIESYFKPTYWKENTDNNNKFFVSYHLVIHFFVVCAIFSPHGIKEYEISIFQTNNKHKPMLIGHGWEVKLE
jgi:hypothetical protein